MSLIMLHWIFAHVSRLEVSEHGLKSGFASGQLLKTFQLSTNSLIFVVGKFPWVVKSSFAFPLKFPHRPQTSPCEKVTKHRCCSTNKSNSGTIVQYLEVSVQNMKKLQIIIQDFNSPCAEAAEWCGQWFYGPTKLSVRCLHQWQGTSQCFSQCTWSLDHFQYQRLLQFHQKAAALSSLWKRIKKKKQSQTL